MMQPNAKSPCLHCGYDLRAAIVPGFGDVKCPECGWISSSSDLRRHGLTTRAIVQTIAIVLAPAAVLVLSAWLFAAWSNDSVHALLCLILAPAVIVAHTFAAWHLVGGTIVLTRSAMRRLRVGAVVCSVIIDVAACLAVARWFL